MRYNNSINIESLDFRASNSPNELINLSERNYIQQINYTADKIAKKNVKFLFLAGPSASSKTTTANKICNQLIKDGKHATVISLDDFYLNRCDLPVLPSGELDFESIDTLDLPKLYSCLEELVVKGESDFPIFSFKVGKRLSEVNRITMEDNTTLIIEGLHSLNPVITKNLDSSSFYKVYISPTCDYFYKNENVLSAIDVRLIRRIVRDYFHRNSSINNTLDMWKNVVASETLNVKPFKDYADFFIDSTMIYEPLIFKKYLLELIEKSDDISEENLGKINSLKCSMDKFNELDIKYLPHDTVLREFL
ncbi:MAG: hypothetical protein RSE93_00685 [Oscillospiraceae bacterium]